MQIEVFKEIPFEKLAEMIRNVPLNRQANNFETINVYKNAHISLRNNISPAEVNPTTFYLLQKGLDKQIQICDQLLKKGIDVFNLQGALQIYDSDDPEYLEKGTMWLLTPPIIEVTPRQVKYVPRVGENTIDNVIDIQIPIINDGAHRVYTAMMLGRTFTAIWISGADPKYPFYAHPNPWDMVKIVEEVPKNKSDKKFYSRENVYGLYRDFGEIGCGAPRSPADLSRIYSPEQKILNLSKKDEGPYTKQDL